MSDVRWVFYDGAQREWADALARITGDVHAFLGGQLAAFESSSAAWNDLVVRAIGEALFMGTDGLDRAVLESAPTIAWLARVSFRPDGVLSISVDARWFPKRCEVIAHALSKAAWCASVSVGSSIEAKVRALDASDAEMVTKAIRHAADDTRARMRKGTQALLAVLQPDAPTEVMTALTEAIARADAIEAEKIAEVARLPGDAL